MGAAGGLREEIDESVVKRVETIDRSEVRAYIDDATPEKLTTYDDRTTEKDPRMTVSQLLPTMPLQEGVNSLNKDGEEFSLHEANMTVKD